MSPSESIMRCQCSREPCESAGARCAEMGTPASGARPELAL